MKDNSFKQNAAFLLVILLFASFYRFFIGLHWDQGLLLHPDERFLTMVAEKVRLPHSFLEYINGDLNPLSPYNNGYDYYVYGNLPLAIVRIIGEILHMVSYDDIYIVGRILSGVFDLIAIVGVFVLGCLLINPLAGLFGSLLLASSVQNIQLSHFMGTENFVGAFIVWSSVLLVVSYNAFRSSKLIKARFWLAGSAALLGLALACKISALFFLPIALIGIGVSGYYPGGDYIYKKGIRSFWFELFFTSSLLYVAITLLFFRIGQPSAFAGMSFMPSPMFLDNMRRIKELTDGGEWPPNVQFAGRTPMIFQLSQMFRWEMGVGFFLLAFSGIILAIKDSIKKKEFALLFVAGWVLFFLSYESTRFVNFGRYLSIIYPFFAVLGGYTLSRACISDSFLTKSAASLCLTLTLLWTVAFNAIYFQDHSRVQASRWIFDNIPQGSVLLNEAWDDGLPLRVDGKDGFGGLFKEVQYNFYEIDTDKKRREIADTLDKVNYVMISSNRQFASIPRLPARFPFTSRYYEMLFKGELGFTLVKSFVVAPHIFGFEIPDKNAVESFTVYDHPAVYIFKKDDTFKKETVEQAFIDFPNGSSERLVTLAAEEISWLP